MDDTKTNLTNQKNAVFNTDGGYTKIANAIAIETKENIVPIIEKYFDEVTPEVLEYVIFHSISREILKQQLTKRNK